MKIKKLNESAVVSTELSNRDSSDYIELVGLLQEIAYNMDLDFDYVENRPIRYNDLLYYSNKLEDINNKLKDIYNRWRNG